MRKKVLFLTNNDNALVLYDWLLKQGEEVVKYSERLDDKIVKDIAPDIIISYNYKYIIKQEIIDYANGAIFNLHISLLPWNRGSSPNYWSFIENTPKWVSIHQVDAGLDTGAIIAQEELFFDEGIESFSSTYQKLHEKMVELFIQNWQRLKEGTYSLNRQKGKGSFHTIKDFTMFTNGGVIDWNQNIADYKAKIKERI